MYAPLMAPSVLVGALKASVPSASKHVLNYTVSLAQSLSSMEPYHGPYFRVTLPDSEIVD